MQIDGDMGAAVALFIIWSGISLVRETISPLLGEAPDGELVKQIEEIAMSYEGALGIHDLVVHNYGPGKIFASLHIEVDASEDVMVSHDLIDNIEHRLQKDLNINITVHMDPVKTDDPNRAPLSDLIRDTISNLPDVLSFHDLRFVAGPTHTNVIFDAVVPFGFRLTDDEVAKKIQEAVRALDGNYYAVVTVERSYT